MVCLFLSNMGQLDVESTLYDDFLSANDKLIGSMLK